MEKNIEEVKKTALEFVRTHTTKDLLGFLLDNLPKDSYTYKSIVLQERKYKRVCQRREENKLKEEEFLLLMNRIDFSITAIIENISHGEEAQESAIDINKIPSFDNKANLIKEGLKNNWLHIIIALFVVSYIVVQLQRFF